MNKFSSKEIQAKVFKIQNEWANSIIKIGKAYLEKKDYISLTNEVLDNLYFFDKGKILFKPTKAYKKQFRRYKEDFISYFIGHNKVSDEDKGFALEPWKRIYFENFDIITIDKITISMGNYFFINYKDEKIKVEYSFGYSFDKNNKLKIIFHHSSIPFSL